MCIYIYVYIYIYIFIYIYIYIYTSVNPCISMHGVMWSRVQCHRAQVQPSTGSSRSILERLIERPVRRTPRGTDASTPVGASRRPGCTVASSQAPGADGAHSGLEPRTRGGHFERIVTSKAPCGSHFERSVPSRGPLGSHFERTGASKGPLGSLFEPIVPSKGCLGSRLERPSGLEEALGQPL